MSRSNLSAANRSEATAAVVRVAILLDIAFPSGTLRTNNGDRPLMIGGNSYTAGSVLVADPSGITETIDLKGRRVTVRLSGVDASLISKVMNDAYHYADLNLYAAFLNASWQLVGDPHPIGDALFMSNAAITLDHGTGVVEISAETTEIFHSRSSAALATPESQALRYAGDTGMDDVRAIAETEIEWGGRRYSLFGAPLGGSLEGPRAGRVR